jgi:hypothetical protein
MAAGSTYELLIKQSGGKMEDTKYTENTGEAQKTCVLLLSENEGTAEEFGMAVEEPRGKVALGGVNVASEVMG